MKRRAIIFAVSISLLFCTQIFSLDNGYKLGSAFVISNSQGSSLKALGTNGENFLAVYTRAGTLYSQILDEQGALAGAEYSITPGLGSLGYISIGTDGTNYLVAGIADNDGSQNVYAVLLDNTGAVITAEFRVNTPSDDDYEWPSVASNGSTYLVTWVREWRVDGVYYKAVYGKQFDLTANPITAEFQINQVEIVDNYIAPPKIASAGDTYFAVWTARPGLYAAGRLYDASAQPLTDEFQMDTLPDGYGSDYPDILSNGDIYLPLWEYMKLPYQLMLRQYDAQGNPLRTEFKTGVFTSPFGDTLHGHSAGISPNGFLIIKTDYKVSTYYEISVQLIDRNGFPVGSNVLVVTPIYSNNPSTASIDNTFLIAWNQNSAIYARLLTPAANNITINQQPQSVTTYVGEDAIFTVNAASTTGPVNYQWYKNHEPFSTDSAILIQDAPLEDTHTFFYCDITDNDGGFVRSDAAVMTVLPPLFTVSIDGPAHLFGGTSAAYTATADFGDGFTFDVTEFVEWLIAPDDLGSINLSGLLSADIVFGHETALLKATLTDSGETHWAYFAVNIDIPFQVTAMNPVPGSTETSAPLEIVLTLSDSVDASSVNTANCLVIKAGQDGQFDTVDDTVIPCIPTLSAPEEITLDISASILPNDTYQIRLTGITNVNLTPLDGEFSGSFPSGDTVPGGDFTAEFSIERLITSGIIFNDNDTVTLTWEPFRDGTVYVVEVSDELDVWLPVEPIAQWPITASTWTGGAWMGYVDRFFRVNGIVPSIYSVSPASGIQGDFSRDVNIIGFGTQLNDPSLEVSFGDGIMVHSITVLNHSQIIVNIRISFEAETGYRDITITTSEKVYVKENAFEVVAQ